MARGSVPKNLSASVRQRLLNIAKRTGEDYNALLGRFATERLLFRLSRSPQASRLVLKGAWLFYAWELPRRGTRDVDFLGFGDPTVEAAEEVLREALTNEVEPDGVTFDVDTLQGEAIRDGAAYPGVRVRVTAKIGSARVVTQIDIGYGDALTVEPALVALPTLLDFPAPRLRAYAVETAVAEKVEAIVRFGTATTRFKDFFDLFVLAEERVLVGALLRDQLRDTFSHRGTTLPRETPAGLADTFAHSPEAQTQWTAFLRRSKADEAAPRSFSAVVDTVRALVLPALEAAAADAQFPLRWRAGTWEQE